MKLKYFLIKGKNKYCSIYVRFWDSKRIDQKTRTGISSVYKEWSASKQKIKVKVNDTNIGKLNKKLDLLERFLYDKYNLEYNNKTFISEKWLKESVNSFFGRVSEDENHKAYFVDWVVNFVATAHKRIHNGKPIKDRTITNYTSTLNKLKDFELQQNKKYRFEDIDLDFYRDFVFYCNDKLNLNNNSIGSLISRIKTFCRNIEFDGLPINPKYKHSEFSIPKQETFDIYLNEKEINSIFNHDFSDNERLDNTRNLFIIGLRTGLRISDIVRIKKENILGSVVNITTQKTNQNLTIPLHPQFKEILNKRNGELPREISQAKFNKYIKEVCQEADIKEKTFGSKRDKDLTKKTEGYYEKWELVASHICRRSFATNLFLQDLDISAIRHATGHTTDKAFLNYVKASADEKLQKLIQKWDKIV
jgi:integrase